MANTKLQAKWIRSLRWLHRKVGLILSIFFIMIAVTGLLLGIKKQMGLLAPTHTGTTPDLSRWLPVDDLHKKANQFLLDSVSADLSTSLDRIDMRPSKGIVKFIYKDHYWGLQLDGATGTLLLIEKRSSDFIENLHDGSILDDILGTSDEEIKVGYTIIMGISLLILVLSGLWLWYGPKRLRKLKKSQH
jgi:uncharacterized iron-regulated membrane protein